MATDIDVKTIPLDGDEARRMGWEFVRSVTHAADFDKATRSLSKDELRLALAASVRDLWESRRG